MKTIHSNIYDSVKLGFRYEKDFGDYLARLKEKDRKMLIAH
jgi:hypothetical protein